MALVDELGVWMARVVAVPHQHRTLLRCPVRQRNFVDGPEERIRQGLLHYFINLSGTVSFVLGAERERHDIDLRWPMNGAFRPSVPPMLIVETKVDAVAGDWTNDQLARYLGETAGDCGLVFTGHRMWRLDITPTGRRTTAMGSLAELADLVRQRAASDPLAAARDDFDEASGGNLDALRRLVDRFPYATYVLLISGRETSCRHLRFIAEAIHYRPADRHARRASLASRDEVAKLVRIEP